MQGTDRSTLIWEGGDAEDTAVCSFTGKGVAPWHLASIQTSQWKLITNLPAGCPNKKCPRCRDSEPEPKLVELYDLQADPGEQHNLADAQPETAARLYAQLEQRIAAGGPLRRGASAPAAAPNEGYLENLRALGYVGDRPDPPSDKETPPDGHAPETSPPD